MIVSGFVAPPTGMEMALHARSWNGVAHYDRCVLMRDGKAVVVTAESSYPDFVVWASTETGLLARPDREGRIWLESVGGKPYTGRVCVSIADSDLSPR